MDWRNIKHKGYNKSWSSTTTTHPWCDGHSTSISAYGVWEAIAKIQVSKREFYTHIHLWSVWMFKKGGEVE